MKFTIPTALLLIALTGCMVDSTKVGNLGVFDWYNCGAMDGTYINNLTITPDPITIPGLIHISVNATNQQEITVPTTMAILLERWSPENNTWEVIPCLGRVGSCVFEDVCTSIDHIFSYIPCPESIQASGLNCMCPIPAGTYDIQDWIIPVVVPLPGNILPGDYYMHLTWNKNGVELFCLDVYTTIEVN